MFNIFFAITFLNKQLIPFAEVMKFGIIVNN